MGTEFTRSVIKSRASFTYDQAQARLDGTVSEEDVAKSSPDTSVLTESLLLLNRLAKVLKGRRLSAGALTLASPEFRFSLDTETQNPVDVEMKEMKDANSMVEEFMLLANISVAKRMPARPFPASALLRRHPNPPGKFRVFKRGP